MKSNQTLGFHAALFAAGLLASLGGPALAQEAGRPARDLAPSSAKVVFEDVLCQAATPTRPLGSLHGQIFALGGANDSLDLESRADLADRLARAGASIVASGPIGEQPNVVEVRANASESTVAMGEWIAGDALYAVATPSPDAFFRFHAALPQAGFYPVYVRANGGADQAPQRYDVRHAAGVSSYSVDHQAAPSAWFYLGSHYFLANDFAESYVELSNEATEGAAGSLVFPGEVRFGNGDAPFHGDLGKAEAAGLFADGASSADAAFRALFAAKAQGRPAPPQAPASVRVEGESEGLPVLLWSPVEGATGYAVYASADGLGYELVELIAGANATKFQASRAIPGNRARFFRVAALGEGGESPATTAAMAFRPDEAARGGMMCGLPSEPDIHIDPTSLAVGPGAMARQEAERQAACANLATTGFPACVFAGDVTEIDLSTTGATNFAITSVDAAGDAARNITGWENTLLTAGRFYYVPALPDNGESGVPATATGVVNVSAMCAGNPINFAVNVSITKGYTNSVLAGTGDRLNTYRIQQRMKYFEFRTSAGATLCTDKAGAVMVVDGLVGTRTRWCIGTMNSIATDVDHVSSNGTLNGTALNFINAGNAPRWRENTGGGTGWTNIDTAGDDQDWGTNWLFEVIAAAGGQNAGPAIQTNDCSFRRAGDTCDHSSHEAGTDVDCDTPSTDDTTTPFMRTVTIGGTRYVAGRNGTIMDGIVVSSGGGTYTVADHTAPGFNPTTAGALTLTAAYSNSTILGAIAAIIYDPAGYSITNVRNNISAFAENLPATTSGAGVRDIYYNDPRTWNQGWDDPVTYSSGHGGHFHVNVEPPATATAAPNRR